MDGKVAERFLAREELFGQRRSLVGQVVLVREQHDFSVEALLAQCFGRLGSAQSAADDDEGFRVSQRSLLSVRYLLAQVVVKRYPHQRRGQSRVRLWGQAAELFGVGRQYKRLGGGRGAFVEVRSYPRPDILDFAQKYVGSGVTDSLELLQQSLCGVDIFGSTPRNFPQVTGV